MKRQPPTLRCKLCQQIRLAQEIGNRALACYLAALFAEGEQQDKLVEVADSLANSALCQASIFQLFLQGKIYA